MEGTVLWFRYFEERRAFFAALFTTDSTVSFRRRLLCFIMEQLDEKIPEGRDTNREILRQFAGTAVLGTLEAFLLNRLETDTEETAGQVGVLLERILYGA